MSVGSIKSQTILFVAIYSVTIFGSLLGMIAVFNSINTHFNAAWPLAIALSLRTVFMFFSGNLGPSLFSKYGIKLTLAASEIGGIFGVIAIFIAYKFNLIYLAILGVGFLGFPGGVLGQGLVSMAKVNLSDKGFRLFTGRLSLITGILFIFTGIATPFLLESIDIYFLLTFDVCTYIFSLLLLKMIKKDSAPVRKTILLKEKLAIPKNIIIYKLAPSLLLIGLLPLIAGQKELQETLSDVDISIFRAGWAFEGLGMILAALIYNLKNYRFQMFLIFSLSSLFLLLTQYINSNYFVYLVLTVVGTSYSYCYMKVRDDYLIDCEDNRQKILEVSGYFVKLKSVFCILSPILIINYISNFGTLSLFCVVLICQFLFLIKIAINSKPLPKKELVC